MAVQGTEEFSEILSLCGMGFGLGALKIVRGMYERAVVQRYLALNPDQVDSYLDYNEVNVRKLLNRAKEEFGEDKISKEMRDALERSYASLDSKFRKQSSWSDLDLLSMARRAGGNLDDMYLLCYLRPTFYAHSTSTSLLTRLKHHVGDEPLFDPTGQREAVQGTLSSAVLLTLQMLVTLNHYFTLGFGDRIGKRFAEFGEWAGES